MKFITKYIIEKQQADSKKPEMVDLGLSVKWAKYNIGANPGSTPDSYYGNYYAWGETKTKSNYTWETYKHCTSYYDPNKEGKLTKYTDSDRKKVLKSVDDVATTIYGSNYRMPTKAEIEELMSLPNKWVENYNGIDGLNGRVFTGKNDNTLFVPAAGFFTKSSHYDSGSNCDLWSSSISSDNTSYAWYLTFYSNNIYISNNNLRYYGFSVRCVSKY